MASDIIAAALSYLTAVAIQKADNNKNTENRLYNSPAAALCFSVLCCICAVGRFCNRHFSQQLHVNTVTVFLCFSLSDFILFNKSGICYDSTSYYRVFGPCLDVSLIPCEEKMLCHFWCIRTVFPPIRIEWILPPVRIKWGWAKDAPRPASA